MRLKSWFEQKNQENNHSKFLEADMGSLKKSVAFTPVVGLVLGFTWIFGEYFATKILDFIESKSSSRKNEERDHEPQS